MLIKSFPPLISIFPNKRLMHFKTEDNLDYEIWWVLKSYGEKKIILRLLKKNWLMSKGFT